MLFGIVMPSYQAFQAPGSDDSVWHLDIVLALGAALVNLPIREARLPRAWSASVASRA